MSDPFRSLVRAAAQQYEALGRYAYHFAFGKLIRDPVFRFILQQGLLPDGGQLFDLGCGQGVLIALLQAARELYLQGRWPARWPDPPLNLSIHGVELNPARSTIARQALGKAVAITHGNICGMKLPQCAAIVILDVLLYLDEADQCAVLQGCIHALQPGGVLLLREADAGAGLAFHVTRAMERIACWARGQVKQKLLYRPVADWVALFRNFGCDVLVVPMSADTPFSNVLFVVTPGSRAGLKPSKFPT